MKKVKITVEFEMVLASPEYYPENSTIQDMIDFDIQSIKEGAIDISDVIYNPTSSNFKITGQLLP